MPLTRNSDRNNQGSLVPGTTRRRESFRDKSEFDDVVERLRKKLNNIADENLRYHLALTTERTEGDDA
jgi:ADP-dependent phosphofructokinase/glucokinase